jgi:hypothetical protein
MNLETWSQLLLGRLDQNPLRLIQAIPTKFQPNQTDF